MGTTRDKNTKRRNIAAEILDGLEEAIRFERGENTGATFKAAPITARYATVDPAPEYDRDRVVAIRSRLRLTQPVFAGMLNVSPETVKAWEQGKSPPRGAANRLLQLAELNPAALLESVHVYGSADAPARRVAERNVPEESDSGRRRKNRVRAMK